MPYLLDDHTYQETENIVLGKEEKSQLLLEFSDWFISNYSVRILNIKFDQPRVSTPRDNRYELCAMIGDTEGYQKVDVYPLTEQDKERRLQIGSEFRLALKYNQFDHTKIDDFFVVYNDFAREAKTVANSRAANEVALYIKGAHVSVWNVIAQFWGSVVFYYSDYDIANNERTGTSKRITDEYYKILKKYDVLNYFTKENISIEFDSKENLDKNFQGSLFYYSR